MAASSSMIKMRGDSSGLTPLALVCGARIPASDMGRFPCHREFKVERGAVAHLALYLDLARVLLDNAVAHRQPQTRASALALIDRRLGGEEGVVDSLHVFERNAGAGVGDVHRNVSIRLGSDPQRSTRCHRV